MTLVMENVGNLIARLKSREYLIGIMGLGYVGLPLTLASIEAGFNVLGFDTDEDRVDLLNAGKSGIKHISDVRVSAAVTSRKFRATSNLSELSKPDAILIAVPTPLNRNREPDLTFVIQSTKAIANSLRDSQLIVLESTTWPGTTREVMKPILEATGLKCGRDFYLAYSPERENPGSQSHSAASIPKVVGADEITARTLCCALYDELVVHTVPVSSSAAAEAVKLTENIFRSVNIALVNELKVIFNAMGIDVWEVIEAAKSKPFGYMPFYPGPGLGGHCIPIDPFYLTWKAREYDVTTKFIELAGEINTAMPRYVVDHVAQALDTRFGRGLRNARILLIGMSYKKNIDDTRESPSIKLITLLECRGAIADYHDPYVLKIPKTREHPELAGRQSKDLTPDVLRSYDAVLISTDHDNIDWKLVVEHAQLVIDTRNVCARANTSGEKVVKA